MLKMENTNSVFKNIDWKAIDWKAILHIVMIDAIICFLIVGNIISLFIFILWLVFVLYNAL